MSRYVRADGRSEERAPARRAAPAPPHALLRLQRGAGNRAVTRMLMRTKDEAATMADEGVEWRSKVWVQGDNDARDALIAKMNGLLAGFGMTATVKRGWKPYDPIVITGAAMTYANIVKAAQGQPDGGKAYAMQLRDWYAGNTALAALPRPMYALAIITHWAEVARGYQFALTSLYAWIGEIADAGDASQAKALWGDYQSRYPPSLKYAEDAKMEWRDSDSEGEAEQERADVRAMDAEADVDVPPEQWGELVGSRLRSGRNF